MTPNKYIPQLDCYGEIDYTKPYIRNKEIKRVPIPYDRRKEYYRKYRQEHPEYFRNYMREYYRRRKAKQQALFDEIHAKYIKKQLLPQN